MFPFDSGTNAFELSDWQEANNRVINNN